MAARRAHRLRLGLALTVLGAAIGGCALDESGTGGACPAGTVDCGGRCVATASDPEHCGACGSACPAGQACSGGQCILACPGGATRCGDDCVDLSSDPAHCGDCDVACAEGQACFNATCKGSVCEPGTVELCYSGDLATLGVGPCQAGTKTCNELGTGFGPCEGEIAPAPDVCTDLEDNDCDGVIPMCVHDTGLVVRYFIDEADSGVAPAQLNDAGPYSLPLAVDYASHMIFGGPDTNRHLNFLIAGGSGRAVAPIEGTQVKVALQGTKTATMELVVDIVQVTPGSGGSRLLHIGNNSELGRLTLLSDQIDTVKLAWNGSVAGEWGGADLDGSGRVVLHLVLDTTEMLAADRVKLYKNGEPVAKTGGNAPALDSTLDIGSNRHLVIGNDDDGGKSPLGKIHYAAIYATALAVDQVLHNAAVLLANDDAP